MFSTVYIFVYIFLFCSRTLSNANEFYLNKDQTLVAPYFGNWQFFGNCISTNAHVSLTSDQRSQKGGIYNNKPFGSPAWEVQVTFKVHGSTGTMFGDGFAFWYTRDGLTRGDAFGSSSKFTGLAVFFDTYSNHNGDHDHEHPYISAMVNDGKSEYDHDKDGTHTQMAGCTSKFRNQPHDVVAAIRYTGKRLKVSMDVDNSGVWKECFVVEDVILPTGYHFGLSAATGDLTDNHDIIAMKVYTINPETHRDWANLIPQAASSEPERVHSADIPKSSFWTYVWYIFVLIIIVVGAIGVFQFVDNKRKRKKRFY